MSLKNSVKIYLKKNKYIKQGHSSQIDWFISVPVKIIQRGHQTEHKFINTIFIKPTRWTHRSGIKTKKGGKYENQHYSVWEKYIPLAQRKKIKGHFMPQRQSAKKKLTGVKPNWPRFIAFVLLPV